MHAKKSLAVLLASKLMLHASSCYESHLHMSCYDYRTNLKKENTSQWARVKGLVRFVRAKNLILLPAHFQADAMTVDGNICGILKIFSKPILNLFLLFNGRKLVVCSWTFYDSKVDVDGWMKMCEFNLRRIKSVNGSRRDFQVNLIGFKRIFVNFAI